MQRGIWIRSVFIIISIFLYDIIQNIQIPKNKYPPAALFWITDTMELQAFITFCHFFNIFFGKWGATAAEKISKLSESSSKPSSPTTWTRSMTPGTPLPAEEGAPW